MVRFVLLRIYKVKTFSSVFVYILLYLISVSACVFVRCLLTNSGMDIVAIMQSWNFNETLIKPFRDSSLGHVAVAYLLYKIATPARYTVTLGKEFVFKLFYDQNLLEIFSDQNFPIEEIFKKLSQYFEVIENTLSVF